MSEFMIPELTDAEWEDRLADLRRQRHEIGQAQGFRPVSLGDWLDLCRAADVPTIAAVCLGETEIEPLLRYDEPDVAVRAAPFYAGVRAKMTALGPGWMARWDCCSMAAVKYRLSEGDASWLPELGELYSDDLRACDIICDFPSDRIKAWARPWTAFAVHDGWPVEYRAFVAEGEIRGISNYYPQRPLPDDGQTAADIERVREFTSTLIERQTRPVVCPQIGDVAGAWFTCDFARLPSGAVVFLEGGPPHMPSWGAHPCCFAGGEIEGVALRDRTGKHEVRTPA